MYILERVFNRLENNKYCIIIIKKTIPYRLRGKQNGTVLGGTVFKGPVLGGGGGGGGGFST